MGQSLGQNGRFPGTNLNKHTRKHSSKIKYNNKINEHILQITSTVNTTHSRGTIICLTKEGYLCMLAKTSDHFKSLPDYRIN